VEDDTVVETFADLSSYPGALSPSTFVIVRRNKKKRDKPYGYPQVLHPNSYFPITNGAIVNGGINTDHISSPNQQMLTPYTSMVTTRETNTTLQQPQQQQSPLIPHRNLEYNRPNQQMLTPYTSMVTTRETNTTLQQPQQSPLIPYRSVEYNRPNLVTSPSMTTIAPQPSIPVQAQPFRTTISNYQYQSRPPSPHWHRTRTDNVNQSIGYASEPTTDRFQRDFYSPPRQIVTDRTFERKNEPRVLHYYTGYDYFATIDPSDAVLTRHHPPMTGPGAAIRYGTNPPYHPPIDYMKSTM
jgi:hypothetical protein